MRKSSSRGKGCQGAEGGSAAKAFGANHSRALFQQASGFLRSGEPDQAAKIFQALIEQGSTNPVVFSNFAAFLVTQGQCEKAEQLLLKALELDPKLAHAYDTLAVLQLQTGNCLAALQSQRQAIHNLPGNPDYHCSEGIILQQLDNLPASVVPFQRALRIDPAHLRSLVNLGRSLHQLGELGLAISLYRKVLELTPADADGHMNLASALLLTGHFEEGWLEYEWRLQSQHDSSYLPCVIPSCPRWRGEPAAQVGELLLVGEQGLGDMVQFMRYAKGLAVQGYQVKLCAPEKLHGLIQSSDLGATPCTPAQVALAAPGCWSPLLSLPGLMQNCCDIGDVSEAYISVPEVAVMRWRSLLNVEKRPLIGLNWQGNPSSEIFHLKGRSLPLERLAPVAAALPCSLLSLQKGPGSEQLDDCTFRRQFVTLQPEIDATWDFVEMAAIMMNCDLVITTDTVTAHLAGGLGVPTWLLLKHIPDWRWGLNGDSTPWYPSMRLFRQKERNCWDLPIEQLVQSLVATFGASDD